MLHTVMFLIIINNFPFKHNFKVIKALRVNPMILNPNNFIKHPFEFIIKFNIFVVMTKKTIFDR